MDGYGKRVLVVEDDEHAGLLMSILLEQAGYNVMQVRDGVDALVELNKRRFDVVVTDYSMPNMNGVELLKQIRSRVSDTPVIMVSCMLPDVMAFAVDSQPYACLRKPYERSVLLQLVRSAIQWPHHKMKDEPVVTSS